VTFPPLVPLIPLARSATRLQDLTLSVLPHGGQRSARRNAWSAMSSDAVLARSRREAEVAVAAAAARADRSTAATS
jgi:hypothetical protein